MDSDQGLIIISMLMLSAFFSGIEIAFLSSGKLHIELKSKQGVLWAGILSEHIKKPAGFITTVLAGNSIALVIYGFSAEKLLSSWFSTNHFPYHEAAAIFLQTVIAAGLILIVSGLLPRILFRKHADILLPVLIFPFQIIYFLLWPLVKTINWLAELLLHRLPGKPKTLFTAVELDHYISRNMHIDPEEAPELDTEIFKNALDFDQVRVRECMVPRNELVAVELHDDIEVLWKAFIENVHSKVLVYKDNIDNIIGYVHQVDLFKQPASIQSVLIPIVIATESMMANDLLKKFTANRKSIAVVVDEFGGTAGIVTIEDIMEEIFGEIDDEHDTENFTERQVSEKEFIFSGRLEVDYLNETYGLNIPEGEYETLGGYIISRYESIPSQGETLVIDHRFEFHILTLENIRIGDVRLRLVEAD
jgi:putative hemolysin